MNDVVPPSWSELWMHITLKTDWESPLPERYLAPLAPMHVPQGTGSSSGSTAMSTITGASSATPALANSTTTTPVVEGVVVRCKPYLEVYAPFRASGKRVRNVMTRTTLRMATMKRPVSSSGVSLALPPDWSA
jgi:hypothetical protein